MYICMCKAVTDREIRDAVAKGNARSLGCLRDQMGIARECGSCAKQARACVREALSAQSPGEPVPAQTPVFA